MSRKPGAKAIVVHDGKILLVLRDNNPRIPYPNVWNTPGGGIEEGETPSEALIRELKEEVNLTVDRVINLGTTTYEDESVVYRFFVPITDEQLSEIRLVNEGQKLDWFTYEEVLELEKSPNLSVYLETFAEDIQNLLRGQRNFLPRHDRLAIS